MKMIYPIVRVAIRRKQQTSIRLFAAILMLCSLVIGSWGQTTTTYAFRYVKEGGSYTNDGKSWETAKNNLQNAIDELAEEIAGKDMKGYVFVQGKTEEDGGMKYTPTRRSTDDASESVFDTSFRIPAGIYVYGGFAGTETNADESKLPSMRIMKPYVGSGTEMTYEQVEQYIHDNDMIHATRRWNFKYVTILNGNHSVGNTFTFRFDKDRHLYTTTFPRSSYHVVWFATNGQINLSETDANNGLTGHYRPLDKEAAVDGCTIEGGFASSTNLKGHEHRGYGGGVYMVKNAVLSNCIVRQCEAVIRGGGVYLDGGGKVDRCFIHTCQTTGYAMQQGYGGGICIDYDGTVTHSYIIQSTARIGAGLAICHVPDEYPESSLYPDPEDDARPDYYTPFCSASVIANCTSTAEGGGVYLDEGGTLNHCTVVNNRCEGPDVIYYGRKHGRTGGIYIRNGGTVFNTVAWGNEGLVNNNVQYASYKDNLENGKDISVYHCAFSRSEVTDWATTKKESVIALGIENAPENASSQGDYPLFSCPTTKWGSSEQAAGVQYGENGVIDMTAKADGEPYQRVYNWHPQSASTLRQKAIQVTNALYNISEAILHASVPTDITGRAYEPVSCIGAISQNYRFNLTPALCDALDPSTTAQIPTLFVDPNRRVYGPVNDKEYNEDKTLLVDSESPHPGYLDDNETGNNWEHPSGNIGNAIRYFLNRQNADGTYTFTNANDRFEGTYKNVQIVVKEGSVTTAGPANYLGQQARTASIRPSTNMRLYGSFPSTLTGTSIEGRNQRKTPTKITANVLNGEYMNDAAHVIALINVKDVIVDGFRLYDGNANLTAEHSYTDQPIYFGGGVIVNNASVSQAERIDMTGNIIRNCVIANCSAPEGAAVYVNGEHKQSDNSTSRAELTLINCVIRNSTAGDMHGDHEYFSKPGNKSDAGVVTANGNAHIWLRNCDIVNNCGYALKATNSPYFNGNTWIDGSADRYQIEIYNSIIFSNGNHITTDRKEIGTAVSWPSDARGTITGNYIYLDYDAAKPAGLPTDPEFKFFNYLTRKKADDGADNTKWRSGMSDDIKKLRYPYFVNPSNNIGHAEDGDKPLYGGTVSYEPLNMNPIVNGACAEEDDNDLITPSPYTGEDIYKQHKKTVKYDAANNPRTYGGDPDAGAVENTRLPKGGSVLYVTPNGAGKRDGSSWGNAIQGNAIYALNGAGPAGTDSKDGDRIINTTDDGTATIGVANGVLTTDSRYCGFATSFFTDIKTGGTSTTTLEKKWTTVTNNYTGGLKDGTVEEEPRTGPVSETNTVINNTGSSSSAGWYDDERYPYGEISGASRFYWRANQSPIPDWWSKGTFKSTDSGTDPYTGETITGIGDGKSMTLIKATDSNGDRLFRCTNNRIENYVGGLQYAVERAAAYNSLPEDSPERIEGIDAVQVWVSNGHFTDYKGFVMRDKTTVMGSFPAKDGRNPGLTERQALMSDVINIPKSQTAQQKNLDPADYETILQISDVDPKLDELHLNTAAVKAWDDDLAKISTTDTQTTKEVEVSVTNNYTWSDREEVTTTYIRYPDMVYSGNNNVFNSIYRHKTDKTAPANGSTEGGVDWNVEERYVYQYFGDKGGGNNSWELVYANRTNNVDYSSFKFDGVRNVVDENGTIIGSVSHGMELSGGMIGMSAWQTMKNVPAGQYKLQIDLAAFIRALNNGHDTGNVDTGITFYIINSQGVICVTQPIYCANTSTPYKLRRYSFDFEQPVDGDLTIRIMGISNDHETSALPALKDNPNRREVLMANVHLTHMFDNPGYVLSSSQSTETVTSTSDPVVSLRNQYSVTKHRFTLRKRVLQMPDVTNPVFGGGKATDYVVEVNGTPQAISSNLTDDDFAHCERVVLDTRTSNSKATRRIADIDYVGYNDVVWDGFTIRHGFLSDVHSAHGGGAGVSMYEGSHLRNCIVINNFSGSSRTKGAGIFCDGSTATIEGCFVLNNTATRGAVGVVTDDNQIFAGALFMYEGTCFNSLFANNFSQGSAGGLGFCVGKFYNNTIAYNTCRLEEGGVINGGAISLATESNPNLFVANTIIYGNTGRAIRQRGQADLNLINPFIHCYIQTEEPFTENLYLKNIQNWTSEETGNYGIGNYFINGQTPSAENTPFDADLAKDEQGNYIKDGQGKYIYTGDASTNADFRLTPINTFCINQGTEAFSGNLLQTLKYKGKNETTIKNGFLYKTVAAAELPDNDVAYADRIQDCEIDIGAYEYDGTKSIEPDLSVPGQAIFYVTQSGGGGLATASSREDAACSIKLQKVLDAAGRWKYASKYYANTDPSQANYNMTNFDQSILEAELITAAKKIDPESTLATGTEDMNTLLQGLKDRTVIVKLAGNYIYNENPSTHKWERENTDSTYVPTRSTDTNNDAEPFLLDYSLIVPHGVQLWGGYDLSFDEDKRDVLGNPTILSGTLEGETTTNESRVYHVVTFTENLFNEREQLYEEGEEGNKTQVTGQLNYLSADEKERAVLDGLFIEDGEANGSEAVNRIGGAAVVTGYAHIRNCIVRNNTANDYGGGLYLESCALVSGTIIRDNSAKYGGGIYVYEPERTSSSTYANIISTTVVDNSAQNTGGGLFFDTNVRANSSVFWKNTANDLGNVAGTFNTNAVQLVENYPINFCGIESRRVEGVNNLELPVAGTEGVRWDHNDHYELGSGKDILFYPITVSSTLGRSGMPYGDYVNLVARFPTLELQDILGLNRMAQVDEETVTLANHETLIKVTKDNAFIEMGARVLNHSFEVKIEFGHVMKRLFVTTTELLPTDDALVMQENTVAKEMTSRGVNYSEGSDAYKALEDDVEMYKQMGSSFLNPFHRFGDALEYIIKVRQSDEYYLDENGEKVWKDDNNHSLGYKTVRDIYKDVRFEVFVTGGTFYPFRDAHGNQGESRANTFVVPEKVSIVGGVNRTTSGHNYCQEGGFEESSEATKTVAGFTLNCVSTQQIRDDRQLLDRNGNHVQERWEMREQTILSGAAVKNGDATNVYHVITCFPDVAQVGSLPTRYTTYEAGEFSGPLPDMCADNQDSHASSRQLMDNITAECKASRDQRLIFIDGVTITGGWANDIEQEDNTDNFQKLSYFRGGGILVDGNWDSSFDNDVTLVEVLGVAKRNIPVIVDNCLFNDNMAANGGAVYTNGSFYAFSSHFTRNWSRGPNVEADQNFIPWTAGGAIANNYDVYLWNCLFDNNEAKRGSLPIRNDAIVNADLRQGYGGAISCSATGLARIANCDFVRNKAVAFPALYNFLDNNMRAAASVENSDLYNLYGPGHHFAVNTLFWGNEATATAVAEGTEEEDDFYEDILGPDWKSKDQRKPWHVANLAPGLDIATCTFSAYEEGHGEPCTVWEENHDWAKSAQIDGDDGFARLYAGDFLGVLDGYFGWYKKADPEHPESTGPEHPVYTTVTETVMGEELSIHRPTAPSNYTDYLPYNYNLTLGVDNTGYNGPFFVQPSLDAGVDGYMEHADWLVSRLNNIIDNGWGMLKQDVSKASESSNLFDTKLLKENGDVASSPINHDEQYTGLYGNGFYNIHAKDSYTRFKQFGFRNLLPIGDEPYKTYVREGSSEQNNMRRISTHPKMGVQQVFIDMGIYEYQYVQLVTQGDETDVIWVTEKQDDSEICDGSTWKKATNNLQEAIETLLLSRNNHDKMIKVRGGSYSPTRMTNSGYKSFYVDVPTSYDGVATPGDAEADIVLTAKSLTIRGGYTNTSIEDNDDGESTRDLEQNPVTFVMQRESGNTDQQLEHLFVVENAEQIGNYKNYLTNTNIKAQGMSMPVVLDGITFINTYAKNTDGDGGAALLYKEQTHTNDDKSTSHLKPDGDRPKLLIKDCTFMTNGAADITAVRIKNGGGLALVVNSLFHSNTGSPLQAVNTKVINSTFALNGGHLNLTDATEAYFEHNGETPIYGNYPSALHNSVIWKDDQNNSQATQYEGVIDPSTTNMTYNTITKANEEPTGAASDTDNNHNTLLSKVNSDVLLGPNFVDPKEDASTTAAKQTRDLRPNPSARLLNQADKATYTTLVPYYPTFPVYAANPAIDNTKEVIGSTDYARKRPIKNANDEITGYFWFHTVQWGPKTALTDTQLQGTDPNPKAYVEWELLGKPRMMSGGIDRGAYECTAVLQRVLYVTDGAYGKKDGTTWYDAFDINQLQKAVDVASIYSLNSKSSGDQKRAYVFVKTSDYQNEALKLRDGVSVYGSINNLFRDEVAEGHSDEAISTFLNKMLANRKGIADKSVKSNVIKGLVTDNEMEHTSGFLLDGFWLKGANTATTPVSMEKYHTVLRNDIIGGNTVTAANEPMVKLGNNSLLYNTLLYNNTTNGGAVVNVGGTGYVLNCTVAYEDGQTGLSGNTTAVNVLSTINANSNANMFAPYFRPSANTGYTNTLPTYLTEHQPYWYQLHEESSQIDAGTDDGSTAVNGDNAIAKLFPDEVNFDLDRDILGNPRRLGTYVDNGCYETWKITDNKFVDNTTNETFTSNYRGHTYPHMGSVLYLMENANMVVDTDGGIPLFSGDGALQPGYVLVKNGASIYGQGNTLSFGYVAAEKTYTNLRYALTALPFGYDKRDIMTTSYNNGNDKLTQVNAQPSATYRYDGARRAEWSYEFQTANSPCWITAETAEANEGRLFDFGSNVTETVRITGWHGTDGGAQYYEDGSAKIVTLTQYDNMPTDGTAHFTTNENMGWNLKGMPWLVSSYRTDDTTDDGIENYQMHVPHLFYKMNGDGTYIKNAAIYTQRSWVDGSTMTLGDAYFTQTAIIGDEEQLTFALPEYSALSPARRFQRVAIRPSNDDETATRTSDTDGLPSFLYDDVVTVCPQTGAETAISYHQGSDGVKWQAFDPSLSQIYIVSNQGLYMSLMSAAPVETDIPVGVKLPEAGEYVITLPDPEAYDDYASVWLIDKETGATTNLKDGGYHLTVSASGVYNDRLILRFGGIVEGQTFSAPQPNVIKVRSMNGRLPLASFVDDTEIAVYSVSGALVFKGTVADSHNYPFVNGVYIVRILQRDLSREEGS